MATNLIQVTEATAIVWAATAEFVGTTFGLTHTHEMDMGGLAAGAAWQGAKADLGATGPRWYRCWAGVEFASGAISLETVDYYWAASNHGTAATGNPSGIGGTSATYTGTTGDSIADSVLQLQELGSLITTADQTLGQQQVIGLLDRRSVLRYGMPVVYNLSAGAFDASADLIFFALVPIDDDIQAAV